MILDFSAGAAAYAPDMAGAWTYMAPPSTPSSPGGGGTRIVEQIQLTGTTTDLTIGLTGNIDDP